MNKRNSICLSWDFYCCNQTLWPKQNGEERVYFSLHFNITAHHQRKSWQELKQGRNLEVGADARAMEECCLLAHSIAYIAWFFILQEDCLGMALATVSWASPHQSSFKKFQWSWAVVAHWWWGSIFSTQVPFLLEDSSLHQVDKTHKQTNLTQALSQSKQKIYPQLYIIPFFC